MESVYIIILVVGRVMMLALAAHHAPTSVVSPGWLVAEASGRRCDDEEQEEAEWS